MEIGIIGLNDFSKQLCKQWINGGHKILFADYRLNGYLNVDQLGLDVALNTPQNVAHLAEIIILSIPRKYLLEVVDQIGKIKQKIVIDLIPQEADQDGLMSDSFEEIQRLLPDSKVVKITPDYPYHLHKNNSSPELLYYYSNDHIAQRLIHWLFENTGYKTIPIKNEVIPKRKPD